MPEEYDYIVIGAGSAGCAVTERLSADPANSVLVVESGPADKSLFIHMPRGLGLLNMPGGKYIWEYQVATNCDVPVERWFRGRTLGGSSSSNGMVYMRGAPMDYDGWEAMGCTGWGWDVIGPKFVQLENHDQGADEWRGVGGPLQVTTHPASDPLYEAILNAAAEMGVSRVADVNSPIAVKEGGMGYQPATTSGNRRFSSARAFLDSAKARPNCTVVTDTNVLRIEFEGKRAVGVKLRDRKGVRIVRARREIVVSAGAFETPKLLQLSGIGPASLLEPLGIEVIVDSPDVGRNLREHRHADIRLEVRGGSQNKDFTGPRVIWSMLRYLLNRSGPMSHPAHEVGGFAKSEPGVDHADLQFGLMTVSAGDTGTADSLSLDPCLGVTFLAYFTRPESQGVVRIQSADPEVPPYIDVNHLSAEVDRRKFVAAFRWLRRLASQPALSDWILREIHPAGKVETDEEILANAMAISGPCFHSAGTARMGADRDAVVDPRLRVRGVEGLRVADTSIMPTLVSGNTNAPAMVIGLQAAEFILADNAETPCAAVA